MEPTRSNEANEPLNGLLREEIATNLIVMPEDENFGNDDVEGKQMSRDMLLSQPHSIPAGPPLADNFQELDLKSISMPMFKKPLESSTPFVTRSVSDVHVPLLTMEELIAQEEIVERSHDPRMECPAIAAYETVQTAVQTVPSAESSVFANAEVTTGSPEVESSSSSTAPRSRRIRREVSFTERLEPLVATTTTPKPRKNFDIFNVPCHTLWNKAIQNVQMQLSESYKQKHFREMGIMREAQSDQEIGADLQEKMDEFSNHRSTLSKQQDSPSDFSTFFQPNELELLDSIDGKLADVSDRSKLNTFAEATSTSHVKSAAQRVASLEKSLVLQESSKHNVLQPMAVAGSPSQQKPFPSKRKLSFSECMFSAMEPRKGARNN